MIATLNGVVSEKLADEVVLDVQGVGYGVYVTAEDHGRLVTGETVKIFVYEHVREQAHDLFGFLSRDTQNLFELLLEVNGVGPKMALNVLSIGMASAVRAAIAGGDVKFIQQASGVGQRHTRPPPAHAVAVFREICGAEADGQQVHPGKRGDILVARLIRIGQAEADQPCAGAR